LSSIEGAILALKDGRFVLVHDEAGREDEIDLVIAAEKVTPHHIAILRRVAGGLICLAVGNEIAAKLGLVFMHDMMQDFSRINPIFNKLAFGKAPYGDMPSFSISVNHRSTHTGITDTDRAVTIRKMAEVCKKINSTGVEDFSENFRSPGHVPILIASEKLLAGRTGHTELCIHLMNLAGLAPAVTVCEMLDSKTYKALSIDKGMKYAFKNNIPLLESNQIRSYVYQNVH
jgi:3,4-dihydroxy 2-butanone 4-phosphate synthase